MGAERGLAFMSCGILSYMKNKEVASVKKPLTIMLTKSIQKASQLAGKGGSTTPGVYARKLFPNILREVRKNVGHVIFITGTNGKTTTSNVLATILLANGKRVINNKEGANLITGITTAFVAPQNISGTKKFDYAVIEIDEGSIQRVTKEIAPDYFVFTNLFKDQVDRFGTEEDLANTLRNVLEPFDCRFILNGNDPHVSHIVTHQQAKYFGLTKDAFNFDAIANDEHVHCPKCQSTLHFDYQLYSKLGNFACTNCDYKAQPLEYAVTQVKPGEITINNHPYRVALEGGYNAFNVAAAVAVASELGLTDAEIAKGLNALALENGRMERFSLEGTEILLNLAKNTAGLDVSLSAIDTLTGTKNVYIGVNNTEYDGTDSSWVNDADYELIKRDDVHAIYCGGTCANDVKQALLAAGFEESRVHITTSAPLGSQIIQGADSVLVIPNYTLLEPVRKQLVK